MSRGRCFVALRLKNDIQTLFKAGRFKSFGIFSVKYRFIEEGPPLPIHLLLAVSKKHGKAHLRNRIKRVSRAAFFEVLRETQEQDCYDRRQTLHIAFIPQNGFTEATFSEKIDRIYFMLKKIEFLK